jgi:hypothetical protein
MLPDLRFVFGAMLAIAMLATAGLGLAISIQLHHDAHGSLDPAQGLAYAAPAEANRFRDLRSAPRFGSAARRLEEPVAHVGLEAPPTVSSQSLVKPDERAAASPTEHAEEELTADSPAQPAPAPPAEAPRAKLPTSAEETQIAPTEAVPEAARTGTPPAEPDPVATAPSAETRKNDAPASAHPVQDPAPAASPAQSIHRKSHPGKARLQRPAPAVQPPASR